MRKWIFGIIFLGLVGYGAYTAEDTGKLEELTTKLHQEKYDEVIRECKIFIKENPDSYQAWNLLGWAYLETDKSAKAEKCFDKVLELNKNWDNAYVGKGALYDYKGQLDKARKYYRKAISMNPNNPEAFSSLLVVEIQEGNDKKAVEYGEKAWALCKDLPVIPANLAVAYHYAGKFKKRDKFFKIAKKMGYPNPKELTDIFTGKTNLR